MNPSHAQGVDHSDFSHGPYEPRTEADEPPPRRHSFTRKHLRRDDRAMGTESSPNRTQSRSRASGFQNLVQNDSITARLHRHSETKNPIEPENGKEGVSTRPGGGVVNKLGTFAGVFVPTSLNVFSVLMFLRFGFILGQSGILAMLGMLTASYIINLVTILSLSAVASNGTVRGGGAYYLISRSLGPEFGGSIGVVFYLAQVFNTGLNAVGLVDCAKQNFGSESGNWASWLIEGYWWQYLWGTVVLLVCTAICCGGSDLFSRASNGLLFILLLSTFSVPFSALVQGPFEIPQQDIVYTGLSLKTFRHNFLPRLTKGANGSQLKGRETFQDLFGILYPATAGVFAGASMSGSLKHPSKAIPKGTLYGVMLTFVAYTLVILAMGATITRPTLYANINVVQETAISGPLILAGEIASSLFSTLMGVIGAANLLQALARDSLFPGAAIFAKGVGSQDIPVYGILLTYVLTQVTLFGDINQIATLVTMGYLMTFLVMNLACFLLKIGSAPNFRPSFRYFNWYTALFGTIICGASMFFVDGWAASGCVALLIVVFLIIHYTTPPKSWGDVSQSLIYHQVRKYLLRLKTEHVKFWRPQILLFVNDPRRSYKLIQFCNSLKKGGLFVLGHVIVAPDFEVSVGEARKQQHKWNKYIDFSRIKAFVQIVISPSAEWGTRNLVLASGLGGMRPNIVVMGFYNLSIYYKSQPLVDVASSSLTDPSTEQQPPPEDTDSGIPAGQELPTDDNRPEPDISPSMYVTMLEDLLLGVQINVGIARNFSALQLPRSEDRRGKKYIDLWPIQMSAELEDGSGDSHKNVLTTNFDTYTLILQLGCILNTVPAWKKVYELRVIVFVEYESDVEEERGRVQALLDNLRIKAQVLVFWLASGYTRSYQFIVNGDASGVSSTLETEIDRVLEDEDWWQDVQKLRGNREEPPSASLSELVSTVGTPPSGSAIPRRASISGSALEDFKGLQKVLRRAERRKSIFELKKRRSSISLVSNAPQMSITTHRLPEEMINQHAIQDSASEDEDSGDGFLSTADGTDVEDGDDSVSSPSRLATLRSTASSAVDQLANWQAHFSGIHRDTTPTRNANDASPSPSRRTQAEPPSVAVHSDSTVPRLKDFIGERQNLADDSVSHSDKATSSGKGATDAPRPLTSGMSDGEDGLTVPRSIAASAAPSAASSRPTTAGSSSSALRPKRPRAARQKSGAKFSSKPVPATKVSTDDGPGPSIMFTESIERPDVTRPPKRSIYDRSNMLNAADESFHRTNSDLESQMSAQSVALSFNDLPCRAQHLILNELMRNNSGATAVVFTTLPSPAPGTGKSEDDSVSYLSDLDVLCKDLPPTLLVHSNSMTVTTNL